MQLSDDVATTSHVVILFVLDPLLPVARRLHLLQVDPQVSRPVLVEIKTLLEVLVGRHFREAADHVAFAALVYIHAVVEVCRIEGPVAVQRGVFDGELRVARRPLVQLDAVAPVAQDDRATNEGLETAGTPFVDAQPVLIQGGEAHGTGEGERGEALHGGM